MIAKSPTLLTGPSMLERIQPQSNITETRAGSGEWETHISIVKERDVSPILFIIEKERIDRTKPNSMAQYRGYI